ncbi:MAG: LLM class flavin-dependent oxidoreductase [Proteobacteria bacterium]|jgi:5,10-methylenetetrahydromethanopterin reductase|nr:LLM class flavin-dependent oxidoreductase [Pseudomonadota bacterium]
MELSLLLTGLGLTTGELVMLARQADTAGFAGFYMAEVHRSGFVPLTAVASATQRLRIGPYVLNAYARSPLITGMSAIDLNEISGGRLVLGVGGGNRVINEVWQGIAHQRVLTKMGDYVEILRRMAATRVGARVDFDGAVHRCHWSPVVEPGPKPFPIVLAAVFPSMMKIAARVADGIGGGATLGVDYLREVLRPQAARMAAEAGRDPASLRWSAVGVIAMDEDRERARAAARAALCHFYAPLPHPYYEHTMREQGFGAAADAALLHMPKGNLAAAMAAISDACLDTLTIAGTPAECRERIAAYAGVVDELLLLNVLPRADGHALMAYQGLMGLPRALSAALRA